MQSFLISTSVVGLAEIGDKTQLLSLVLAARYRKPIPIILGVFAATLINHGASGALGAWLASVLSPGILNWAVVASLIETCKLCGVEPHAYLTDIIARIVNGHPNSQIDDLLPWAYDAAPSLKAVA